MDSNKMGPSKRLPLKNRRGKKRTIFLLVSTVLLSLFFFRNVLFEECIAYALKRVGATSERVLWLKGKGYVYGVSLHKEDCDLTIDRAEIDFHLDGLYVEAHLSIFHPEISLSQGFVLPGLVPSKFFGLKLDVHEGVLNLGEEKLSFGFQSGQEREEIGTFSLYNPELVIDLEKREEHIFTRLNIRKADFGKVAHVASFFYPHQFREVSGLIDLQAEGMLDLSLFLSDLQFSAKFTNANFSYSHLHFSRLNAELAFDGIPQCNLRGDLNGLPLDLRARGSSIAGSVMGIPLEVDLRRKQKGIDADFTCNYQGLPVVGTVSFTPGAIQGKLDTGDLIEFGCEIESFEKFEGWILAERLQPETYRKFVKDLSGEIELTGKFDEESLVLALRGEGIVYTHPFFTFSSDTAHGELIYKNKIWSGKVPLEDAVVKEHSLGLTFEEVYSTLRFENTSWFLDNIETNLSGLKIVADAQGDFQEFKLVTTKMEGDLAPLSRFSPSTIPLTGKIVSRENGFCLDIRPGKAEWNFKGSITEGKIEPYIEDLTFDVAVTPQDVSIWNLKGTALHHYTLIGHRITKDLKGGGIDAALLDQNKEIARLVAKQEEKGVSFDPKLCHFFGSELNIVSFDMDKHGISFEMKPHILAHGLQAACHFLAESNLFPLIDFHGLDLHGDIFAHLSCKKNKDLAFSAETKNLKVNHAPFPSACIRGKKCGAEYVIEQFSIGKALGKCAFVKGKEEGKWTIPDFEFQAPKFAVQGEGEYSSKAQKGSFSLHYLEVGAAEVACKKPIQVPFTCDFTPFVLNGKVQDGVYNDFSLKNIAFKCQPGAFAAAFKTMINDKKVFAELHLDFSKEMLGMLKLQEDPKADGLKILFKEEIQHIEGKLSGLEVHLKKKGLDKLAGSVTIDAEKACPLFPKTIQQQIKKYQLGAGYKLEGLFTKNSFQGTLKGKKFFFLGYQLESLDAEVEASKDRVYLGNVYLRDPMGSLESKEIFLTDTALHIPLIELRAKPHPKKPFRIETCNLYHITGDIKDLRTLKGKGQLYFTNQKPREPHFLDVPLDIIKSWGLDPGLLTPVQGEIDLELIGEKLYLTELHNMFSEGERSQFYLSNTDSYVDMKGNIHIDLKMKQDVALKLTEPFVLTVRGTLKKPKYGFTP